MAKVSLITVNFNQTELTFELLQSVRSLAGSDLEVIVVDNGSTENPASLFQAKYPFVRFIRSEQNLGFAGGNNLAITIATGDYLFFVNNDTEISPNCIQTLAAFLQQTPNAGMVSPLICYHPSANSPTIIQYAGMTPVHPFTGRNHTIGNGDVNEGQYTQPFRTAYAHGAAMMISRKVLDRVGPMPEEYFLYYEELDWCTRIKKAGYEIWLEPRATIWHKESATLNTMGATKTYYLTRNRIRFMRKHFGGWRFGFFCVYFGLIATPKYLITRLIKGDWSNISAFFKAAHSSFGAV
ncbi:MAG: glycosyltransferase family 2 protein [Saprospiraceae bacterium]|nr:glycosyltransferase family 2 protein [Saprospiraceae bacterium]